jgi:hypothetical protein
MMVRQSQETIGNCDLVTYRLSEEGHVIEEVIKNFMKVCATIT